jgi:hypothetical protein
MNAGGINFVGLYGYNNDGSYNYLLDNELNRVFKFSNTWLFLSSQILPFYSPYYFTFVNGNWFVTSDNGIYKTDSTFTNIVNSVTPDTHYGLYFTNSTIYAVKSTCVIEYTTSLTVSFSNEITGDYTLWSITASGSTIYIGTSTGLVLVMVNRVVTDSFNACNGRASNTVNSIMVQENIMITECYGDSYFYNRSYGTSFSYLSGIVADGTTAKGVWVDLKYQLIRTDLSYFEIYNEGGSSTATTTTTTSST